MKTIVLAGGGTAGHITPHIAILPKLKESFDKIYYVGSGKNIEQSLISGTGVEIFNVDPPAFIRSLSPKNLLIPYKLHKAVKECEGFLKRVNASIIFSKGGYCALPVCFAGFNLKIPVVCHESDLTVGLANKLCAKKSKAFLTTFEQTAISNGGICVGPIIREDFFKISKDQARKKLNIKSEKPVLLVTGGSQGSKTLNECLEYNLKAILNDFTVIHLHGKNNKPAYSAINGYYPFAFADMPTVINACDIALSRGGSNTLFELLSCSVPTLCVPLKKNSRGDQIKNANYFKSKNALYVLDEDFLKTNMQTSLKQLLLNKNEIQKNIKNLNLAGGRQKVCETLLKYSN